MNDPHSPDPPQSGTVAAVFFHMRWNLEKVAQACIRDHSYDCARKAMDAAEAINDKWDDEYEMVLLLVEDSSLRWLAEGEVIPEYSVTIKTTVASFGPEKTYGAVR